MSDEQIKDIVVTLIQNGYLTDKKDCEFIAKDIAHFIRVLKAELRDDDNSYEPRAFFN
ncbi:hypothetical protein DFR55_10968 [Herbinix hemicellulosilytica]|uniref:Uncharacterized protein n=1 Tax=Herbinix hemicellulosilytica TaxID=1564487 RepID=A0A0H5SIL7_HERHM|nr:hypothetical protein [Herbinix hemicellulosilytica]RBP58853.1 hypothetical protein DFR55_10968 [Herbinix hemicellulosilytica]CRZ34940.1 hypothetical protein HHT355_1740 [Herbinix hemicellulosilytica]